LGPLVGKLLPLALELAEAITKFGGGSTSPSVSLQARLAILVRCHRTFGDLNISHLVQSGRRSEMQLRGPWVDQVARPATLCY